MLTFKRKLILTHGQANRIDSWIGACRVVYNLCIEIRREGYKNRGITVHRFELDAQLKTIKHIDWIKDVPHECLSTTVEVMDRAYQRFFKTFKTGGGFPRFTSKKKYNSIRFKHALYVKGNFVRIPKIGYMKMVNDSAIIGDIKIITVKRELGAYYACITTDAVKSIQNQDESQVLGIDMGIARLLTDSQGGYVENPRHYRKYEKRLRIENRSLSRKKRFGKNWIKQAKKLSKLHRKIAAVRSDFLQKESTRIAKSFHTVIIEDLNISGLKRGNVGKSIGDAGWGLFRKMLEYKTQVIAIDPRFTSQTCNDCGECDKKSRISQSEFVCTACGTRSNADENAARNILDQGMVIIRKRGVRARA